VFHLADITAATLPEKPVFDEKTFNDHGVKFIKHPDNVEFGLSRGKRSRRARTPRGRWIRMPARQSTLLVMTPKMTEKPVALVQLLRARRSAANGVASTKTWFVCTHTYPNGTKCQQSYSKKQSLNNRMRSHTTTVTPKRAKPRRKQTKVHSRELKLTVSLDAYKAMTARVGNRGREGREKEERDQRGWKGPGGKVWVESSYIAIG
jgi:hypothetical protein